MRFWFTYLVRCKDNSLYCGITDNLQKRVDCHNSGKGAKYTRGRRPVKLVWFRPFGTRGEAAQLECEIKKLSKRKKEEMIKW